MTITPISRSSRMTTAAGVFAITRFRLWIRVSISSRVGRAARTSRVQEVMRTAFVPSLRLNLQLAVQRPAHS